MAVQVRSRGADSWIEGSSLRIEGGSRVDRGELGSDRGEFGRGSMGAANTAKTAAGRQACHGGQDP
jgi:hypothetical protein